MCRKDPPIRNLRIPRAGRVHHSEIGEFHALEGSIAQELQNPTRRSNLPLRNFGIPRAVAVHRSGIGESHAQERSTARELRNLMRGTRPPIGSLEFQRMWWDLRQ